MKTNRKHIVPVFILLFLVSFTANSQPQVMKLHTRADVVIEGKDLMPTVSGNLLSQLAGRVAGVRVIPSYFAAFAPNIRIRNSRYAPLYILDGVYVDAIAVNSVHPDDVDQIEILKSLSSAMIYGGQASGGVIAVYTIYEPEEGEEQCTGNDPEESMLE